MPLFPWIFAPFDSANLHQSAGAVQVVARNRRPPNPRQAGGARHESGESNCRLLRHCLPRTRTIKAVFRHPEIGCGSSDRKQKNRGVLRETHRLKPRFLAGSNPLGTQYAMNDECPPAIRPAA